MMTAQGPTVGRRRLRTALRRAREAAGLTQEQVADAMDWSLSKLIRIEAGSVSISTNDVKALLSHYRVADPHRVNELVDLAKVSRQRSWWSQYRESFPPSFVAFIGLEAEASKLSFFQSVGVPGLVQTEAYANSITSFMVPALVDPTRIKEIVSLRRRRQQEVLDRPNPPQIEVVLDESILHRQIGSAQIMHDQLQHLVSLGQRPHINIRVLPFSSGMYTAQGQFIILQFGDEGDNDVVYVEGAGLYEVLDQADQVKRHQEMYERLREHSLDPAQSLDVIAKMAGRLK
ncbi:helix-turn-helix transcriptional regulator [Actinomycetes bacterium KLBMP 9797]